MRIVDQAVRARDPFLQLHGHWLVRRLAPDCGRIDLQLLPKKRDIVTFLADTGWETANIHLGMKSQHLAIRKDLQRRKHGWLLHAARRMAEETVREWREFRS